MDSTYHMERYLRKSTEFGDSAHYPLKNSLYRSQKWIFPYGKANYDGMYSKTYPQRGMVPKQITRFAS